MTNPGPLGGPDRPDGDPLAVGEVPPPAVPPAPAYEPAELVESTAAYDTPDLIEPTPAYDALAQEAGIDDPTEDLSAVAVTPAVPATDTITPEADYALAPDPGAAGPLTTVKAFAAKQPAAFIGVALFAGWLVGKIFSSSDDD